MNGAQDLGGMHGFGPVTPESNEPVFHAEWERRVLAISMAMGSTGEWNLDMMRSARENCPPAEYLANSYYEIWLAGLERLVVARGLVSPLEIAASRSLGPPVPLKRVLAATNVGTALARGAPTERPSNRPSRFVVGEKVRAKNIHPKTHTRLPRYVRGHLGIIERVHGCHVFADSNATGTGEDPQWLYTVCFDGCELWGPDSDPSLKVSVDAWEPYLEST
jgi:nitrile hydratase beta subunit